jgi:Fe-S-cluster containining protein
MGGNIAGAAIEDSALPRWDATMEHSGQDGLCRQKNTIRCGTTKPAEKAVIVTMEGDEITVAEQAPIPCFRCGICCTRYQPPLSPNDIEDIAAALRISRSECLSGYALKVPIKEGYLLRRTAEGCVFLARDADGKARCTIHPSRPRACRDWTPSLVRPECREGRLA